jgi:hypothetical protein
MTPAQLSALKAAAQADPNVLQNFADGNDQTVADYYNANHASRLVWRPQIMVRELNTAIDWSAFALLSVAKQNAYMAMTQGGFVDGTAANVRSGFNTVFGAGVTLDGPHGDRTTASHAPRGAGRILDHDGRCSTQQRRHHRLRRAVDRNRRIAGARLVRN